MKNFIFLLLQSCQMYINVKWNWDFQELVVYVWLWIEHRFE